MSALSEVLCILLDLSQRITGTVQARVLNAPTPYSDPVKGWPEMESHVVNELAAIIGREDGMYVALCPELDIASQGETVAEARDNLNEALELFFETASGAEVEHRLDDGPSVLH